MPRKSKSDHKSFPSAVGTNEFTRDELREFMSQGGNQWERGCLSLAGINFFPVYRDLLTVLPKLAGLLLNDLMNRQQILLKRRRNLLASNRKKEADKVSINPSDGSFKCSMKFLMSCRYSPKWSEQEQRTWMKKLVDGGYVRTARVGREGVRWVWINYAAVFRALNLSWP